MKLKIYNHAKQVNQNRVGNCANARNPILFDICGLAIILLIFYTFYLGSYPLFTPDEARYSEVAREMIASGDYITPRVDGVAFLDKPILYYWLQVIAIKLFGVKEWALRLFPALIGIFGCLMVYLCGNVLFNRESARFSALILATSLLYFAHAHYANLDLEVAVFISTSLLLFITAMAKQMRLLLYGAYIFAAFAFLTKGLIGLFFPIAIIGMWILLQWRFDLIRKMHLVSGLLLFTCIVLPWYVLVQNANPNFLQFFFVTQQVTRFLSTAEFNNQSPFWFYIPIILVGFFPWTIFILQAVKENIRRLNDPIQLFLCVWVLTVFIFFSIPHSKIMGYILPLFPPLALIIGNYLAHTWKKIRVIDLKFSIVALQMLALFLGALLILTLQHSWLDLPQPAKPYLYVIAGLLLTSVAIAGLLYGQKTIKPLFWCCLSLSLSILLTLLFSAPTLNQNSTKPLITYLQTIIKPQDEVIHYYKFYYDAPLYLARRITIVNDWQSPHIIHKDNWERELWFGMPFQKTSEWLIGEDKLWQRFGSSKRIFIFVNRNYLEQFKTHMIGHAKNCYELASNQDVVLLSNQASGV